MQQRTWYSIVQHRTRAALSVVILQRLMRCEHSFMAIAIIWFGGGGRQPLEATICLASRCHWLWLVDVSRIRCRDYVTVGCPSVCLSPVQCPVDSIVTFDSCLRWADLRATAVHRELCHINL